MNGGQILFTGTGTTSGLDGGWLVSNASDSAWCTWNTATTTVIVGDTWKYWAAQAGIAEDRDRRNIYVQPNAQEVAARQVAVAAEAAKYRAEREAAEARAKKLLVENISPAQRKQLADHGFFDVVVSGRTYRIRWGTHGNVRLVVKDREVRSFCIQPDDVPVGDAMLAQKLMLECDEASFLRIANARDIVVPGVIT